MQEKYDDDIKKFKKTTKKNTSYDQSEMALLLGVKQNTYSTWESGAVDVKSEYLPKIAELLKVEIKDLFQNKTKSIKIEQNVYDNKDSSINGLVLIVTEKTVIQDLVDTLKSKQETKHNL